MANISPLYWIVLSASLMGTAILAILYFKQKRNSRNVTELNQEERLAISEFATVIVNHDNMHDVLWELMHSCISRLGFADGVVYLFDKNLKLVYHGAYTDDSDPVNATKFFLKDAMNELKDGKVVTITSAKSVGCTIKRAAKN